MKQRMLAVLFALALLPGLAQAKIFLVDTDDTLRVVTASGVSTIHMYAAWADLTTTALTPGNSDAQVTTATTTVLVAAPGASTQRQIKGLSIRNSHASSSNVITVQFYDGATATELISYTLLAGETLQWGEDENFRVIDASGQVKGLVALATGTNSVGQVTANAGTNLNTSSLLTTTAHDAAFGTAGSADSQVRTVQGIASMTPLLTNPGTAASWGLYAEDSAHSSGDNLVLAGVVRSDAAAALAADGDRTVLQVDANGYLKVVNINPNLAADNSTLSTSKVPVLPGTVSTSAPTWTNGNQSALSLQTDGSVRSAVTNTVTVTASNLDVQIGGSDSLTIGTFPDNEPFNIAQMNGVTVSMGVGASGTGTQRVASLIHDGTDTAQVTATAGGSLQVECTSGCGGSGGTSMADDAAFTPGTSSVTPMGATFNDVSPDTVNEGDIGAPRMSANRVLYGTIRDAAGNERGANVNASNELQVAFTPNSAVNVAQMNGTAVTMGNGASGTGVQRVTIANDSTGVLATVNSLTQMNGQTIAMGTGTRSAGTQRVTVATDDVVPASQSGTWTVQPGNTANTTPWLTSSIPATSGGTSVCYITSAASTNATNCKASAGQLYGFDLVNTTATVYYLRLYNSSSAPTCSSATGFVRTIPIPASTTGAGIARSIPVGEAYGTGIGFCLTGGGSSTDNTNAATGVYVTLNYK